MSPPAPEATELIYKEYVRLSDRCAGYVETSFSDIKLFGAVGSMAGAWAAVAPKVYGERGVGDESVVGAEGLLLGFVVILAIVTVLGLYHAIKQSLVVYYVGELSAYEAALAAGLDGRADAVFRWSRTYGEWRRGTVKYLFLFLLLVLFLVVYVLPMVILGRRGAAADHVRFYSVCCSIAAMVTVGAYGLLGWADKKRQPAPHKTSSRERENRS